MKKLFLAGMFFSLAFYSTASFAGVEIEGRYWVGGFSGEVKVTDAALVGTKIDLADDLGMDDENFPEARLSIGLGKHHVRYAFTRLKWDGEETLAAPINFNGETYVLGAFVESSLDVSYHRLGYQYDVFKLLGNHIGVIAELKYFDMEAGIKSALLDETQSLQLPIPALGVSFGIGLPVLLDIKGEITGMSAGSTGNVMDAEAMLNFHPAPFVTLSGGYRFLRLSADKDDNEADIEVDGPFIALTVGF